MIFSIIVYSMKPLITESFMLSSGYADAKSIAFYVKKQIEEKQTHIPVFIDGSSVAYPNACVPVAAIIDHFKSENINIKLNLVDSEGTYLSKLNLDRPFAVEDYYDSYLLDNPFDKIWSFETAKGENRLVSALILSLRQSEECAEGIVSGLEWCLNEVMDNVLNHSKANKGFVMAQYHPTNKQFNVCVFDNGVGIYDSFAGSNVHPKTKLDAITLAIKEKVTRDTSVGQGNGLWGLHRIIEHCEGSLKIISDGAFYQMVFDDNGVPNVSAFDKGNRFIFEKGVGTTMVDFQMHVDKAIDVGKVLNISSFVDLWEEEFENENGDYVVDVEKTSQGTGTRPAAEDLRNIVLNLAVHEKKKVILDFGGVGTISSSYADELIGKLIAKYGVVFFNNKFNIINMSKQNVDILERSVQQRLAQTYYDSKIQIDE